MTTKTRNPRRAILAWYAYAQSGEPGARRGKHARPRPPGLRDQAENHGLEALIDFILPGDMKALLNQVMAAQKEAEANLIRRREETAAARSQANTAKLLAENPTLARLKEMELLKEVLAGAKATFVFGSGDVAEQVRGLVTSKDQD